MSRAAPADWYRATGMRLRHSSRWPQLSPRNSLAAPQSWTAKSCIPGQMAGRCSTKLMRRRGPFCFYAFDLLWLDGSDLRGRPHSERKTLLRKMLPRKPRSLVYVQHFASGTDLFRVICERDMEGAVAKLVSAKYTPEATTWVKIKNRTYSQAVGREDFFQRPKAGP